jgi:hypothetical protein
MVPNAALELVQSERVQERVRSQLVETVGSLHPISVAQHGRGIIGSVQKAEEEKSIVRLALFFE